MADLKQALEDFDRTIALAELDSERILRVYGATESEIQTWRKTELRAWKVETAWHRKQIIAMWAAEAAEARRNRSHRTMN